MQLTNTPTFNSIPPPLQRYGQFHSLADGGFLSRPPRQLQLILQLTRSALNSNAIETSPEYQEMERSLESCVVYGDW